MKSIAFHIEKGGTGKTTLAGNVGYELARYGKTLFVDCDPQASLSSWYVEHDISADLSDVLQQKADLNGAMLQLRENLYILPTVAIGGTLQRWTESNAAAASDAIRFLLNDIEAAGFLYGVFDLGPGISDFERSILTHMDEVVGVAAAEYFAADGLEIFEHELSELYRQRRAQFIANKLVVNRYNRSYAQHQQYLDWFENLSYSTFWIGQSTAISDCIRSHQSIFEYEPGNKYTTEIQRLAQAVSNGN